MPRVWVPQRDDNRDFSSAKKFGELVFVLGNRTDIYPDMDEQSVIAIKDVIEKKLHNYENGFGKDDYLLLSGDPAIISMCVVEIMAKHFDYDGEQWKGIRLIKYDRENRGYYLIGAK